MESSHICEGDTILLYCIKEKGYVFSQYSSVVTLFPAELSELNNDPLFPNVHFACFQVLADNAVNIPASPLDIPKETFYRDLIYGRKIKLLHVASNKYLSLSSTKDKGQLNPLATLVDRKDFNNETCVFRILPAQPKKHRGDEILSKDKIKLASVSRKEHHVLVAKNSLTDRYELKMAFTDSTFAIYCQASACKVNDKALRGCGVVMLFDMKLEAYLAGCASMGYGPNPVKHDETINEVGARHRGRFHGIQKAPPFSGECFWQIEKLETPLLGDQLKFYEQCRIKHIPSQQYLSVPQREVGEIVLKKLEPGQPPDPEITFTFVPVEKEDERIAKGACVQLQHIKSAKNLTVQTSKFSPKSLYDPSSQNRWFKLKIKEPDDSYFRIDEVKPDLIHDYHYVSGVTALLNEHMKKLTKTSRQVPSPDMITELLQELREWIALKRNGASMLRIAQGVDVLVSYLQLNIEPQSSLSREILNVLHCYINYASKRSHFYLAHERFLNVLFCEVGHDLCIEEVLSTLVKKESAIAEKILRNADYRHNIMSNLKHPCTLEFLSTLCFTAGKPFRHLQTFILKLILSNSLSEETDIDEICISSPKVIEGPVTYYFFNDMFYQTEIVQGKLYFSSPEKIKGPVAKFCSKKHNTSDAEILKSFIAQLKLLSGVCKGINLESISLICKQMKHVTFEEALTCINSSEIHPLLQSAYLDLIISAFVDHNVEESGIDIDHIWHCYDWISICHDPIRTMKLKNTFEIISNPKEMKGLQTSIRLFLKQNKVLCAQREVEGVNELLTQMLSVMESLVSHGFYWEDEDVIEITDVLVDILNGESDRLNPNTNYKQKERYQSNGNIKVFQVKIKVIRVLHFFLKQLCHKCTMKLIYDFKYLEDNDEKVPYDYTPINESLRFLLNEDYKLNNHPAQIVTLARDRLRSLLDESAYKCFDRTKQKGQDLIKILVDLMKYENNELRISSALLLFDIFDEENLIFREATISYLVTEPCYEACKIIGSFCDKDTDKCLLNMVQGTAVSDKGSISSKTMNSLQYIAEVCTVDNDETQPHHCHQMIAVTSGVLTALLTYVLRYCGTDHKEQEELLKVVCSVLQRIVFKNKQAQERICDNFVDFLDVKLAISSVACVLTEALCGNPDLCHKLSEGDIRQIYSLAANDTSLEYCDFYSTLQTIMKPYKSPYDEPFFLKKHQELIAKTFKERSREHVDWLMMTTNCKKRLTTLQKSQDDSIDLLQLLSITDMLSTCAEGQCKYAENVCQKIFTLEELVSIISDPVVSFERKKPFTRLLTWAYLNAEGDSLVSISYLCNNELFWTHMEQCSLLITSLTTTLSVVDKKKEEEVKQKLRFLFSHHMTITAWKKKTAKLNNMLMFGEDEGLPLNSFLFYLIDSIIPLVTTFCAHLCDHSTSSLLAPQVVSVLKSINDSSSKLVQEHKVVFKTTIVQMQVWNVFFNVLNDILPSDARITPNEFRRLISQDYIVTPALMNYNEIWKKEQELNQKFQHFITNFKMTYEGRTEQTMTDDIDRKRTWCFVPKRFTESDVHSQAMLSSILPTTVYDMDDILPTGASFIALVDLFTKDIKYRTISGRITCKLGNVKPLLKLIYIVYQRLQQPITSKDRADLDSILQMTLQVISGVVHIKINELRRGKSKEFVKEYKATVEPLQKALVDKQSPEKVLLHLTHPKDEIAIQVLGFLDVLLYQGNRDVQINIRESVTSYKDVTFFKRISKLLENVISSFGKPQVWKRISKQLSLEVSHQVSSFPEDEDIAVEKDFEHSPGGEDFAKYIYQIAKPYKVEVTGDLLTSKDEAKKTASVVLEVVASMCDGQNREMQDLFRKQDQSFANINLLVDIITLLQILADDLNECTCQLIQKNIQALIEICAGNYSNQEIAFKGQVVDSINIILRRNANFESDELTSVCISAIELLEVMLEETDDKSKDLAVGISNDLDVIALVTTMKDLYNKKSDNTKAEKGLFKAYHVLRMIADYYNTTVNDYVKFEENDKDMWNYVYELTRSIEVRYVKDEKEMLTRVYFRFDSSEQLLDEEKQTMRKNIKRYSPEDNVNDLIKWIFSIRKNKEHKRIIYDKWYFQWSQIASRPRKWALMILTLLLNLFVLTLFKIPQKENKSTNSTLADDNDVSFTVIIFPDIPIWYLYGLLYILGIIHFILAVWMVAEYFILKKPNILLPRIDLELAEVKKKFSNFLKNQNPFNQDINECNVELRQYFEIYMLSFAPLYRICFVIFSLLALGTSGYFYCCCILYIFLKWPTLDLILTALRRSAFQLISVGLLGLAVLFIYAVFSFVFLHNFYDSNTNLFCKTLLECYISVIRVGLLDTLGTALPMTLGEGSPTFTVFWTRTIFDVAFFIIITTLGLNIIIAILVDRFSELRSEEDNIKKNENNYCFICGIENDTFEQHWQAKGFDNHIRYDHNMWSYIYFALHLDTMHPNDHNALEKYVYDNLENHQNCFFPLRMAKVLGGRVCDNSNVNFIKELYAELKSEHLEIINSMKVLHSLFLKANVNNK